MTCEYCGARTIEGTRARCTLCAVAILLSRLKDRQDAIEAKKNPVRTTYRVQEEEP
jgi:hypothetical protein